MHLLAVQPHQCKYGIRATNNGISVPSSFRSNPSTSNVHNCRPVLLAFSLYETNYEISTQSCICIYYTCLRCHVYGYPLLVTLNDMNCPNHTNMSCYICMIRIITNS